MKVEGEVSMLKRVFRGLVVAMLLVGVAVAGPFEDGNAALESGDYVQASKWYRLAADQGNAYAQGGLGVMYAKGEGVPQDYVLAHMWLNLAAAQGQAEAVKNRDLAASKMTRDQLAEAQRLARDWKPSR